MLLFYVEMLQREIKKKRAEVRVLFHFNSHRSFRLHNIPAWKMVTAVGKRIRMLGKSKFLHFEFYQYFGQHHPFVLLSH